MVICIFRYVGVYVYVHVYVHPCFFREGERQHNAKEENMKGGEIHEREEEETS